MIRAVARVMWLALLRDRGALMLAFVLPPLLFFVFAEVFSASADEDLALRVALEDRVDSDLSRKIIGRLQALDGLVAERADSNAADRVRSGQFDVAVVIRDQPAAEFDRPPLLMIGDASRSLAAAIVAGRVQGLLQTEFPALEAGRSIALVEALAGPYTTAQSAALNAALEAMRESAAADEAQVDGNQGFIEQHLLAPATGVDAGVSYYAGAVAILFLLFSAFQGAISLIDERNSGILDRLVAGPGRTHPLVLGKGLFLTFQGLAQASLIFVLAWWIYGLDWTSRFGPWLLTTLLAASVAAWLGLLLASLCSTRQQAQTASAFVVLILSAVGGSMMPRFLMPGWLREAGWLTPNAWAIESWQDIFWRQAGAADLAAGWLVLAGIALVAMLASLALTARMTLEK
ncbi:MAG: ABC transporter permease [Wenzhouxiangella sp.]